MIYLDYNATSPVRPDVRQRMAAFLEGNFGNPSSLHAAGRQARAAVEAVRAQILAALGDPTGQLIFTSGGTEADNLALKGIARALRSKGNHLMVSSVEHHAVLHAAEALVKEGFRVTVIPVDRYGTVDLQALEKEVTPQTVLISVMHANNEVGTIQSVEEISRMARERGILFHTDAVQSFGKIDVNVRRLGADLASISSHKLGGPKGAGALYLRQGIRVQSILHGGPHEHGFRAGTENAPGIVGMGAAADLSLAEKAGGVLQRVERLRDRLQAGLFEKIPEIELNGHPTHRLPGTLNVSLKDCHGETLLMALDLAGTCVSTGSACSSGSTEPSHVLVAMGLPAARIEGSIRFSLGWGTTEVEIEEVLQKVPPIVERIRKGQRHWEERSGEAISSLKSRLPRPPSADSQ